MKNRLLIVFILLCTGMIPQQGMAYEAPGSAVTAQKGVLDLRHVNLGIQTVSLHGEWLFYWQELLEPGVTPQGSSAYIPFPSLWKDNRLNGQTLPSGGYATYALTILLPRDNPRLALEVPDVYCAYSLYVNGTLRSHNGRPGKTAETSVPFWTTQIIPIPNTSDTLHLLMQVSNFWHAKGGTYKEILIGERGKLALTYHQNIAFDLVLAGCLFMGGLFFFGFFIFGKRDKAILYFSLFCIVYSYRMIGTDLYVLHSIFPHLNWLFTIKVEYLCLTVAVALFSRYLRYLYPEDIHLPVLQSIVGFCLLYAAIIVITPPVIFTKGLHLFLVVMFLYIGYVLYVCVRAVQFKRLGAVYALISGGIVLLVTLLINLHYFGLIIAVKWVVFTGYILFFFLQSLVLSHRFAHVLNQAADEAKQGLKARSEFLSTMSHEIRTPLNVVIGMTHLLLRSTPRKDQEKNLNVLLFSANNLLALVNDILDYNKIEAGKINFEAIPMDLASVAQNITGGLNNKATEKQIELLVTMDQRIRHKVIGDPTRTSQVIYNLVHNAIKFTEKGSVTLAVAVDSMATETITVTISVADTGIGIAPEKQQLIFERFTQADSSTSRGYGGTGLGLAITKGILNLQGIPLQLKSEPGKGSVFYFTQTFPLSTEPVVSENQETLVPSIDEKQLEGISILVVEDNPFNIMVAQSLLERSGASVEVANNGVEALEKVQTGKYHMILMDLNMPVMDGFEATRNLRLRGETLPIIALTASVPSEVEKEVRESGLTDIVVKPFNPDELFRVILPYLKEHTAPQIQRLN
jgi:signal transduction histidine kinase/ActR/RegA family two-component response regulator